MYKIADIVRSWLLRIVIGSIIVLLLSIIATLINTLFLRAPWLPLVKNNLEDNDKQVWMIELHCPWLRINPFVYCLHNHCCLVVIK